MKKIMAEQYKYVALNHIYASFVNFVCPFRTLHPIKYYRDYLSQNIRPDGRGFTDFRPIVLNVGSINTADGSSIAKVGNTTVVCGIKAVSKPHRRNLSSWLSFSFL